MGLAMASLDRIAVEIEISQQPAIQGALVKLDSGRFCLQNQEEAILTYCDADQITLDRPVQGLPDRAFIRQTEWEIITLSATQRGHELRQFILGKNSPRIHHGLSKKGWILLGAASLLFPLFFWFAYPKIADIVAEFIVPDGYLDKIAQSTLDTLDDHILSPSRMDHSRIDQINQLYDELIAFAPEMRDTKLIFRHSEQLGANALALPNGTLIMLDDLVRLAKNDDELAAVIAHELGHIHHRHSIRQYVRATGLTMVTYFIIGDTAGYFDELVAIGTGATQLSYGRDFELEADRFSADIMLQAGRDPDALITMLEKLKAQQETGWFSTHPGLLQRQDAIE